MANGFVHSVQKLVATLLYYKRTMLHDCFISCFVCSNFSIITLFSGNYKKINTIPVCQRIIDASGIYNISNEAVLTTYSNSSIVQQGSS